MNDAYVIIMAGGEGTRFYPLSTPERPKQFLNFIGDKTFIRQTYERILPLVKPENVYVATNEKYRKLVCEQIPEIPEENIIPEPFKRNTAPALAYSTAVICKRCPEAVVYCLPSDHFIKDENGFRKIMVEAHSIANDGYIVTLGMKPTWPSTDYGYICPSKGGVIARSPAARGDEAIPACHSKPFCWFLVKQFTEKPKKEIAEEYIKNGHLWNGGIFIWEADVFLGEVNKYVPELSPSPLEACPEQRRGGEGGGEGALEQYFKRAPSISIDYAVMEKSEKVAVIPADIGWSDVGTWDGIERLIEDGVTISKHVSSIMKGCEKFPWRRIVSKPWGHEEWWAHTDKYVGKMLFIKKGSRLSLQYHKVKEETLRLINGEMELELEGGKKHAMCVGDVCHIPRGTLHRMTAKSDCLVVEVSTPEVEDVVRVEDDFGR